jgi:hypothetical protein
MADFFHIFPDSLFLVMLLMLYNVRNQENKIKL